jgi:hypothetical protein
MKDGMEDEIAEGITLDKLISSGFIDKA